METPMKQLIEQAIASINSVADVNTVIGEPVTLPNGVTVVPFSKVSVGFATGGSDRAPKTTDAPLFAGGSGAGRRIQGNPVPGGLPEGSAGSPEGRNAAGGLAEAAGCLRGEYPAGTADLDGKE